MKTTITFIFPLLIWSCASNAQINIKTKAKLASVENVKESYVGKTLKYFITQSDAPKIFRRGIIDDFAYISFYYENEEEIRAKKANKQKITVFIIFLNTTKSEKDNLFTQFENKKFFKYSKDEIKKFENLTILGITSSIEN